MSKYKHTNKPAPTAFQGAEVKVTTKGDGTATGHVAIHYDSDDGAHAINTLDVADLTQDQRDCLTTFAGLLADAVEAEGYEKDPHTRRKKEKEAAEEQRRADEKAARDADPVVPGVG